MRLCLALLLACSSAPKPAPHPPAHGTDAGVAEAPISQDDCDALVTHVVEVMGPSATDDDRAAARADMHRDCKGMTRASYTCGMAATTREALEACDPSAQPK